MSAEPQAKKQKLDHNSYGKNCNKTFKKSLEPGQLGFFATCNFFESKCIHECYNILNQYANELYGSSVCKSQTTPNMEEHDIVDDLQNEINSIKGSDPKKNGKIIPRFQAVNSGVNNCIFIKTTLENPVELGIHIVSDIFRKKERKSRYLIRLVPIEIVCRAQIDDITEKCNTLFDRYFCEKDCTYSIVFNKRYNQDIKRQTLIDVLANLVKTKNPNNKVDLTKPEKSVIVEVVKGLCCLSVVEGYFKYKKYNLMELANTSKEVVEELKEEVNGETKTPSNNELKMELNENE